MADDAALWVVINEFVEKIREPLGLDRWTLKVGRGDFDDPASCIAQPEYKHAQLDFDLNKLETGDELDEIVTHEAAHCHTATIHDQAQTVADALVLAAPEYLRPALKMKLDEDVRLAAEDTTTQVGFTYIRLLRRWWAAADEAAALRAEVKALRRRLKEEGAA